MSAALTGATLKLIEVGHVFQIPVCFKSPCVTLYIPWSGIGAHPTTRSGLARSGRGFYAHTKPNQEATKACSPFKNSKFDVNFVEFEHFETFNFELLNAQFWR